MSVMKDLQWISCCGLTVPCRAARCPVPNWGMITSRSVSGNTSQTRHPQHASETLGADDMWHAIMQIAKVNVTHFLAYERQFLSLFSEQALSLHNIRRAFPQISCAEPMERQRHHFTSLGMEKKKGGGNKQRKALQGTMHGSGVQVVWHIWKLNIKAFILRTPTPQLSLTFKKHWCGVKS